jgi:hypothetical protein
MKQRTRTAVVSGIVAVVVAAVATAGVVALRGGLDERRNARLLAEPGNVMVPTTATVKSGTGSTEWKQMPVRFDTAEGEHVETMVWTRHPRVRFDTGDRVDIEYVGEHPTAARLVGQEGGPADYKDTILAGATILLSVLFLVVAVAYDAFAKRRRRHRPPGEALREGRRE